MPTVKSSSTGKDKVSRRRAIARSLLVTLILCVMSGGIYFARQSGTNSEAYRNDFNVYYHAAKEVASGRDPYQNSLGDWTPYLYPPLLAELMIPLAILPVPAAAYVWFLISAASMFGAAWMSEVLTVDRDIEAVSLLRFRFVVAAAAMLVVSRFMLDTFNLGQVNAIVAALAVSHLYLFSRGRKVLSAMALVLAVSIKLTPALLIVYHIAKLRLKYAAACVAILVAVTALSFLPFEPHGVAAFRAFANRTLKNEQGYNLADTGNQSLRAAIARLVDPEAGSESRSPGEPVSAALAIILLVAAVFSASRAQSEIAGGASFFCCMVLLSPLSWKAHFVMLVLPIAFLFSLAFNPQTSAIQRRIIVLALLVCFVLLNLTSPRIIGLAAAEWADAHSFVTIAALIVFVAVICFSSHKFGKQQRVC